MPELRHVAAVTWAEFSPNGQWLATSSDDKTARLWDARTGRSGSDPLVHAERVVRAQFSSDSRYLLTRTDHTVSIFDVADGRLRLGPLRHDGQIVEAKFLPDGKSFFTAQQAGQNSTVQAWDVETGKQRFELKTGPLSDADLNADLSRAVTVFAYTASIWDVVTGKKLRDIVSSNGGLLQVAFSPSGKSLAMVGFNQWARIWDTDSGLPITPELAHGYSLKGLAFLGPGDRLLTWGEDSLAQVWSASTGESFAEPMRHSHRVQYAECGFVDGKEVFLTTLSHLKSRSEDTKTGAAQLWRIHDMRKAAHLSTEIEPNGHDGEQISRDGRLLAIGKTTQKVLVLETATGKPVCEPLAVDGSAWGIVFAPMPAASSPPVRVDWWHAGRSPVASCSASRFTCRPRSNPSRYRTTGDTLPRARPTASCDCGMYRPARWFGK